MAKSSAGQIGVIAAALSSEIRAVPGIARQLGFDGVLIDAKSPNISVTDLSATGRREFQRLFTSQQVQLVGMQSEVPLNGKPDLDRIVEQADRWMQFAAEIALPVLCLDLGPDPKSLIPALMEIGNRADRYGVMLAARSSLANFATIQETLQKTACPWIGIDLDPVTMLHDEWNADEIFSKLGSLIRHVRVKDAVRGSDRRIKPTIVGQGSVEWPALMAKLTHAGYHGWLTADSLEMPDRVAAASAALKRIQALLKT